jgi:uncharacterized phage protein (TIGR01671 family)
MIHTREFKFRVWDINLKKLLYPVPKSKAKEGDLKEIFFDDEGTDNPNYIVQQFIGVKGAGDVDIYEGDIVKYTPFGVNDERYGIKIGVVEYNLNQAAFVATTYNSYKDKKVRGFEWLINSIKFEVIGNIFENPELVG